MMGSRDLLYEILGPTPYISGMVEARNFKFGTQIGHWDPNEKLGQRGRDWVT